MGSRARVHYNALVQFIEDAILAHAVPQHVVGPYTLHGTMGNKIAFAAGVGAVCEPKQYGFEAPAAGRLLPALRLP